MGNDETRPRDARMGIQEPADGSASRWYKDAVFYEVHVRAFADSDGDGIGDFPGADRQARLPAGPRRHRDLAPAVLSRRRCGTTATTSPTTPPFTPPTAPSTISGASSTRRTGAACGSSPSWCSTTPPTSTPGFSGPAAPRRAAPSATSTSGATRRSATGTRASSFEDFEHSNWAWDPVADAYYWHRFYAHQPDLNFDNPAGARGDPRGASTSGWSMGVDGLRLDAVPYLFEREGTTSREPARDARGPQGAPARTSTSEYAGPDAAGRGQPVAGGRRGLLRRRRRVPHGVPFPADAAPVHGAPHGGPASRSSTSWPRRRPIPETCQWALFLRNHDELTLEMVTDEERLYMYRAYAPAPEARINLGIRRRLAPLLGNSRRRIELMNALLFSLPGTPIIYYGDEIGMGDNIYLGDRDGVRTPMQWSADRNAGFSPRRPAAAVPAPDRRRRVSPRGDARRGAGSEPPLAAGVRAALLAVRQRSPAFGRGSLELLDPANHRVLAFVREYRRRSGSSSSRISRVSARRSSWTSAAGGGRRPVELFGRIPFWTIGDATVPAHARPARLLLVSTRMPPTRSRPGWPRRMPSRACRHCHHRQLGGGDHRRRSWPGSTGAAGGARAPAVAPWVARRGAERAAARRLAGAASRATDVDRVRCASPTPTATRRRTCSPRRSSPPTGTATPSRRG